MTRRRFNSEMTRRALSNTPSRIARRLDKGAIDRWRRKRDTLLIFLQANKLRDTRGHQRERRYQHPEPPALPDSRQHNRNNQKRDADEKLFESVLKREFPATPRPVHSNIVDYGWLRLRELTRQCLRHEADIRSTRPAKTRTIEVLGSAPGTEHLFSAFHVQCSLASGLVKQHTCRYRDI